MPASCGSRQSADFRDLSALFDVTLARVPALVDVIDTSISFRDSLARRGQVVCRRRARWVSGILLADATMRAERVPDLLWESSKKREDAGVHDAGNKDLENGLDAHKVAYRDSGNASHSRGGQGAEGESEARARPPQRHRGDDRERHFRADGRQRTASRSERRYQSRAGATVARSPKRFVTMTAR